MTKGGRRQINGGEIDLLSFPLTLFFNFFCVQGSRSRTGFMQRHPTLRCTSAQPPHTETQTRTQAHTQARRVVQTQEHLWALSRPTIPQPDPAHPLVTWCVRVFVCAHTCKCACVLACAWVCVLVFSSLPPSST